jgi:hypothetical protein
MEIRHGVLLLGIVTGLTAVALPAKGQAMAESRNPASAPATTTMVREPRFTIFPNARRAWERRNPSEGDRRTPKLVSVDDPGCAVEAAQRSPLADSGCLRFPCFSRRAHSMAPGSTLGLGDDYARWVDRFDVDVIDRHPSLTIDGAAILPRREYDLMDPLVEDAIAARPAEVMHGHHRLCAGPNRVDPAGGAPVPVAAKRWTACCDRCGP